MNKTDVIIRAIAEKQNIPITKAYEMMNLYTDLIAKTISHPDKENEDGLLDINKFKIISVQHFGKFVPREGLVKMTNTKRLKEKNK
jgi:hypothetical protein